MLGINPLKEPIPVVPSAHYICGGILVDLDGKTNIPNLYAVGEASCTGVHGANRLASNSLLESIVFGFKSAHSAKKEINKIKIEKTQRLDGEEKLKYPVCDDEIINTYISNIRSVMWKKVGIVRNNADLKLALSEFSKYKKEIEKLYSNHTPTYELVELRNIVTVALMVTNCAIMRKESRGLHYNTNYPEKDDVHYKKDTTIRLIPNRYQYAKNSR